MKQRKQIKKLIFSISVVFLMIILALVLFFKSNVEYLSKAEQENKHALTSSNGNWYYELNDDSTVNILEYRGSETDVTIPTSINGTVTSFGTGILWGTGGGSITNLTIPSTVTNVANGSSYNSGSNIQYISVDSNNSQYTSEDGVLFNKDKTELIRYPEKKIGTTYNIPDTVTTIGEHAFWECGNLENVEIPTSVTKIGYEAFRSCKNLKSIKIPAGVTTIEVSTFEDCTSLKSVEISNGVKKIYSGAFDGCTNLESVKIPSSVTTIFSDAFNGCDNLTIYCEKDSYAYQYAIDNGMTYDVIDDSETTNSNFEYTVNSDGSTITLKKYTGTDTYIVIPSEIDGYTVTGLSYTITEDYQAQGIFSEVNSPISVIIPSTVTKIHSYAFHDSPYVTSIEVSGDNKYYSSEDGILFNKDKTELLIYPNNKEGTTYTIPSSVTTIGIIAFGKCTSLTNIEIPSSVTTIREEAFNGCTGLTSIEIPSSVTSIEVQAFEDCANLTSIEIPSSVTSIGDFVFANCDSLASIEIPSSVTSIGNGSFYSCDSLTSIEIPSSVTSIGDNAFAHCDDLTIYCESGSVAHQYAIDNNIPYELTDRTLESISVKTKPSKTTYMEGESLDLTGGELTLTYNNNTTETLSMTNSELTVSGFDTTTAGTKTLTVTYGGKSTTFTVTVNAKILSSISVKIEPTKTTYIEGESLDLTGGELTLTYNNNTTETLSMTDSEVTASGFDSTTAGIKTITLSYKEKTTTFDVTVNDKEETILGDISGDGKVDSTDLLLIKRHIIAGSKTEWLLEGDKFTGGDMNSDGTINATDLLLLKRKIING